MPRSASARRRDAELGLDQVDAGDRFGDRVLDLDARVALDEIVLAALRIDQELHRAGVEIAGGPGEPRASFQDLLRSPGSRPGAGAISTTFWLRSCTEQSRSCRWTISPWPSPESAPRCAVGGRSAFR
jgi:hypothetical protein